MSRSSTDGSASPDGRGVAMAFAGAEEAVVLTKVDRHILPFLLAAYLFQQLDKSTLMYASVFGLVDDAHLVGKQLSWLGSVLYLASLVSQPIGAMVLVKYPLGKVIATAIFLWGMTLCMMSNCTTFTSLLVTRFILGVFESIIAPSCLKVTQMWWKKSEQTLRVSSWNAMNGVAPVVGGLMSYGLGHIQTKSVYPYQIIFLACGLLTIVLSIPVWLLLPDTPMQANFLTHREKMIVTERLKTGSEGVSTQWRWSQVGECLCDFKTVCWVLLHTLLAIPSGGISIFGSLIVKDFGFDKFQTILFNIPVGFVQLVAILGSAWLATWASRKGPIIALICLVPMLGCLMMLNVPHIPENRSVLLAAYLMVTINSAITPLNLVWQAQNTAGETKKQCTTALMYVGLCFGNVVGPLLYDPDQAPLYSTGLNSSLLMFTAVLGVSIMTTIYLKSLNGRRAGRSGGKGRYTRLTNQSLSGNDASAMENADEVPPGMGSGAFRDLTDFENKGFEYVL